MEAIVIFFNSNWPFDISIQGIGIDASHFKNSGASKQHEYIGQYGSGKQSAPG